MRADHVAYSRGDAQSESDGDGFIFFAGIFGRGVGGQILAAAHRCVSIFMLLGHSKHRRVSVSIKMIYIKYGF